MTGFAVILENVLPLIKDAYSLLLTNKEWRHLNFITKGCCEKLGRELLLCGKVDLTVEHSLKNLNLGL